MRRLVPVALLAASAACSSGRPVSVRDLPPRGEESPLYGELRVSYAVAWDEVLVALTARYGAPETTNRKIGLIRTEWIDGVSEYIVDEAGAPARTRSQLTVRIVSGDGKSAIRVTNEERVGIAGTPVPSSTTKEIELLERILHRGSLPECLSPDAGIRHSDYGDCRLGSKHAHNAHRFAGDEHVCPVRGRPGS